MHCIHRAGKRPSSFQLVVEALKLCTSEILSSQHLRWPYKHGPERAPSNGRRYKNSCVFTQRVSECNHLLLYREEVCGLSRGLFLLSVTCLQLYLMQGEAGHYGVPLSDPDRFAGPQICSKPTDPE